MKERETVLDQTSVVVVTYESERYVERCLDSVLSQRPGEVVVVDGGSTDSTVEVIAANYPDVTLFEVGGNPGFGTCANLGVDRASGEYLVVANPDIAMSPGAIEELVPPLADGSAQLTAPKILTFDSGAINTCGNHEHFTGLAFVRGFGRDPEEFSREERLAGVSGACFAATRAAFDDLGGFDERLFLYMEDAELSWRALEAGYEMRLVPSAVVHHEYGGWDVDAAKLYHLERGRYVILRKHYSAGTAALLVPSLLTTEALTWGYATLLGFDGLRMKYRGTRDGLSVDLGARAVRKTGLPRRLDVRLPAVDPRYGFAGSLARSVANVVYRLNYALYRLATR